MSNDALLFPGNIKIDVFGFKKAYVRNFGLGISLAVLIHFLLIGVYYFIQTTDKSILKDPKVFYVDLSTQQPSINTAENRQIAVLSPTARLKNSIPVPVPDDKTVIETSLPTQGDISGSWNSQVTSATEGTYKGVQPSNSELNQPGVANNNNNIFEFAEKEPQVVESALPVYPELARKAGLEGTVYVKVLVGKDGRPIKAVAIKFDAVIFVNPSVDAAMKFIFTPGLQQKSPVMVWTVIPFKFRLNN